MFNTKVVYKLTTNTMDTEELLTMSLTKEQSQRLVGIFNFFMHKTLEKSLEVEKQDMKVIDGLLDKFSYELHNMGWCPDKNCEHNKGPGLKS